jgi:hypothetical protein
MSVMLWFCSNRFVPDREHHKANRTRKGHTQVDVNSSRCVLHRNIHFVCVCVYVVGGGVGLKPQTPVEETDA